MHNIRRQIEYHAWQSPAEAQPSVEGWFPGWFHGFHRYKSEEGPEFTYALVERADGGVFKCQVESIRFIPERGDVHTEFRLTKLRQGGWTVQKELNQDLADGWFTILRWTENRGTEHQPDQTAYFLMGWNKEGDPPEHEVRIEPVLW